MWFAGETACATNGKSFACIGGACFSLPTPACGRIPSQPPMTVLTVEELLQLLDLRLGFVQETPGLRHVAGVERGLGAIQVGVHQVSRRLHVATQVQAAGGLRALQRLQAGADAGSAHADQGETLADLLQLGAAGPGGGRRLVLY